MEITCSIRAEALLARLSGAHDRLQASLLQAVERLSIRVQSEVKEGKLTGQVLHVRTGTLRRSINRVVEQDDRKTVATVGTNVVYGRIHEYGYQGTVDVREHARNVGGTSTTVRAHQRNVNLPERSFLRSTLREYEGEINATLREAALRAVQPS